MVPRSLLTLSFPSSECVAKLPIANWSKLLSFVRAVVQDVGKRVLHDQPLRIGRRNEGARRKRRKSCEI